MILYKDNISIISLEVRYHIYHICSTYDIFGVSSAIS